MRLDGVKFQIAEGGLESGPLRRGTHDPHAHFSSRYKIPLTHGLEFLPVERTERLDRILFTHCAPPDFSGVGEVRHRGPIGVGAGKDYDCVAPSVEELS